MENKGWGPTPSRARPCPAPGPAPSLSGLPLVGVRGADRWKGRGRALGGELQPAEPPARPGWRLRGLQLPAQGPAPPLPSVSPSHSHQWEPREGGGGTRGGAGAGSRRGGAPTFVFHLGSCETLLVPLVGQGQMSFMQSPIQPFNRQIDTEHQLCASEQTKRCMFFIHQIGKNFRV